MSLHSHAYVTGGDFPPKSQDEVMALVYWTRESVFTVKGLDLTCLFLLIMNVIISVSIIIQNNEIFTCQLHVRQPCIITLLPLITPLHT